jgi:hypothetical protein
LCHTNNRLLIATGGDGEDVILETTGGVVAYNVMSGTVRQVVDIDSSKGDTVSPSRVLFRESLMWHRFFETRPHPGLRSFNFGACLMWDAMCAIKWSIIVASSNTSLELLDRK